MYYINVWSSVFCIMEGEEACNKDINIDIFAFRELWFSWENKHAHRKLNP